MTDNRNNEISFEIMEHIAVLGEVGGRAEKWTKALVDRYRARANQEHAAPIPMRDDYVR